MRLSILLTEMSNPSGQRAVFARLPEEHRREIAAVLLAMVGGAEVAGTIMRAVTVAGGAASAGTEMAI